MFLDFSGSPVLENMHRSWKGEWGLLYSSDSESTPSQIPEGRPSYGGVVPEVDDV
jgi:hypothetical protein